MKEMLKSKVIIGFIIMVFGITYMSSSQKENIDLEKINNNILINEQ